MSESEDADDLERIRERKLEKLREKARSGTLGEGSETDTGGTPEEPIHFDGGELTTTVNDHHVALVDFYAEWCGPCRMLEPTLERIAAETNAAVVKVDIDAHKSVAGQFHVQSVPTMILFVDGQPTERLVGVKGEGELKNLIAQYA